MRPSLLSCLCKFLHHYSLTQMKPPVLMVFIGLRDTQHQEVYLAQRAAQQSEELLYQHRSAHCTMHPVT